MKTFLFSFITTILLSGCILQSFDSTDNIGELEANLKQLNLPEGFRIEVYGQVEFARSLAVSSGGTLFVGNMGTDKVFALRDTDGDYVADEKYTIGEGMRMPNGVAFKDGDLYVAEVSRINKFHDIENKLSNPPAAETVIDTYPTDRHHGWKYIAFGPDGKLYVPVGAPCNICLSENEIYASITRINPDGTGREIFAHGVRNTVGFTWHPESGDMYFTDNGRDWLGDDSPSCELNKAAQSGQHYGYPFCHAGTIQDPEFDSLGCEQFVEPFQNLGPHVAPLGIKFKSGSMFPDKYDNVMFIAEHGSWNRSKKIGYRITMVGLDENGNSTGYETFIDGWLNDETQESWGRPVDLLFLPDGSMLISDDQAGAIYRVTYEG